MEFKNIIDTIDIQEDEILASFDVSSLLTNIPVNRALDIIYDCLESDSDLDLGCPLDPSEVIKCLELCLRSTLSIFRDLYRRYSNGFTCFSDCSEFIHACPRNQCNREKRMSTKGLVTLCR
ncbi:unnamed protein product [Schistosoma bovis]|nr:unnamed protein product [Schistosoma bovis]